MLKKRIIINHLSQLTMSWTLIYLSKTFFFGWVWAAGAGISLTIISSVFDIFFYQMNVCVCLDHLFDDIICCHKCTLSSDYLGAQSLPNI